MTTPGNTPPQWGPQPPRFPSPQARNGLGIAALVLGIIGVLCGLIPLLFWAAGVLAVLALVFGFVGIGRARKGQATNKKTAIWGTSLGGVAAVLAVVGAVISITVVNDAVNELDGTGGKKETSVGSTEAPSKESKGATGSDELGFGDAFTYDDGVRVTVAKPTAYQPSQTAFGHEPGNKAVKVKVTVVNDSDQKIDLDLSTLTFKDADGAVTDQIYDSDLPKALTGTLLPGKQAVATYALSLPADAAQTLEVQVEPGFLDYDEAIWSGPSK
jgi:hypothetical protein